MGGIGAVHERATESQVTQVRPEPDEREEWPSLVSARPGLCAGRQDNIKKPGVGPGMQEAKGRGWEWGQRRSEWDVEPP